MVSQRIYDLKRLYSSVDRLRPRVGGERRLGSCNRRLGWPRRGVYFFMEEGEARSDSGKGPRIVRVGTHALKPNSGTKLWTRLSQHRGQTQGAGGNHRGSIFRLNVGTALMARDGHACSTWDVGNSATSEIRAGEIALERAVSSVMLQVSQGYVVQQSREAFRDAHKSPVRVFSTSHRELRAVREERLRFYPPLNRTLREIGRGTANAPLHSVEQ
jgi:hypothetical protein